ncbi:MAG: DUF1573 domain-containing protein [Prevotellaceae bacterium]|nr:DUF1573 domain-containing protein [Prevotellaceae bacterium]
MKKIIVLCLSTFLFFGAYAQNKGPVIDFVKKTHDFGSIKEKGGIVSCTFEFTNKGSAPLVINNVLASCGCTTPEWTKAPVAPGKNGSIKIAYNPDGRPYPFDKTVTVNSNASESTVILHIKGNVEQKPLTIEEQYPATIGALRLKNSIIAMARMTNTASRTEVMEMYNDGTSPLIVSFENVPAYIKMEASPISIGAKQKGTIKCTYIAAQKKDFGPVSDMVTIKANNAKGNLEIQATIEEDFSKLTAADFEKAPVAVVKSASVSFGSIKKGEQATVSYEITNAGKSDLTIRKLTPDCKCIQAKAESQTIKAGQTATVTAVLNSANEVGQKFYNITATTNAPRQQLLNLFMSGNIQ